MPMIEPDALPPVPDDLIRRVTEAFTRRSVAPIAPVVFDSRLALAGPVRRASSADSQLLTFAADEVTVDLQIDGSGTSPAVLGQLSPPAALTVLLETPDATLRADADESGFFVFVGTPRGPVRMTFLDKSGRALFTTSWLTM
jgi:hypothetical protein